MDNNKRSSNSKYNRRHLNGGNYSTFLKLGVKFLAFVFQIEPKDINKSFIDEHWSLIIQEELN